MELTHFVGQHLPKEERFDRLIQIVQSGHLHQDTNSINLDKQLKIKTDGNDEAILLPEIISFFDASIYKFLQNKKADYNFGLVFNRDFLVTNGANPVFYITGNRALNQPDTSTNKKNSINRADWFSVNIRNCVQTVEQLKDLLGAYSPVSEELKELKLLNQISKFLWNDIFAFIQPIDVSNSGMDSKNTYLGEWRITGSLAFSIGDISRIIIPKAYGKKLRERLPDYYGEIVFA